MWNLYCFFEFKNGFGNNIPKYFCVFVEGDKSSSDKYFETLMGGDYDLLGFNHYSGQTKEDCWNQPLNHPGSDQKIEITGFSSLDECLALSEFHVHSLNSNNSVTQPMNCCKCGYLNDYASSNNDDGTYTCYKCRKGI